MTFAPQRINIQRPRLVAPAAVPIEPPKEEARTGNYPVPIGVVAAIGDAASPSAVVARKFWLGNLEQLSLQTIAIGTDEPVGSLDFTVALYQFRPGGRTQIMPPRTFTSLAIVPRVFELAVALDQGPVFLETVGRYAANVNVLVTLEVLTTEIL